MLSFYLFRRYFLSSRSASLIKVVAWICLAGLTVSVASLILIVSVMGGFGEAIKKRLLSNEAHLAISFESSPFPRETSAAAEEKNANKGLSPPAAAGEKQKIKAAEDLESAEPLKPESLMPPMTEEQKAGIKEIVFFETQDLIIKNSFGFWGAAAKGYSQETLDKMRISRDKQKYYPQSAGETSDKIRVFKKTGGENPAPIAAQKDSPPSSAENQTGRLEGEREIFAGPGLSMEMGLYNMGQHNTEQAEFSPQKVSLIPLGSLLFPPSLAPPVRKAWAWPADPPAERGKSADNPFVFYRQGSLDFGDFSKIQYGAEIKLRDPNLYPLYKEIFKDYKAQSWADRNSTLFFALKLEKFIMTFFITLAFIISSFGISSALFLLIAQKGKDLGILHAMGLSRREIIKTFTQIGFCLSLLGILAGALTGVLITVFLKYSRFNFLPEGYLDRSIPAIFEPASYLIIIAGSVGLAWAACYFPTRHLSRMKPAELLKITGR